MIFLGGSGRHSTKWMAGARYVARRSGRRRTQPKALSTVQSTTHLHAVVDRGGRQPPQDRFDCRHQYTMMALVALRRARCVRMHPPPRVLASVAGKQCNACDDDGQETINWIELNSRKGKLCT
jgi:hypothetical protein